MRIGHIAGDAYSAARIRMLDPLTADEMLSRLPTMNARADVESIVHALSGLLPSPDHLPEMSVSEAWAAMRDICLFLGSLKRHGVEPVDAVPEVEPILMWLGQRTNMIPRDTVYHYTELNPGGIRQRMYTGNPQEGFLIEAVRMTLVQMGDAVELCRRLYEVDPTEAEFSLLLAELSMKVASFDAAIDLVMKKVTPRFFAEELRPYFEKIWIGQEAYLGPAAAHVPLFLVDLAAWASDHGTDGYAQFCREFAQYTLPRWQGLVSQWRNQPSLVTRVVDTLARVPCAEPIPGVIRESVIALGNMLRTLMMFRGKHVTIARKAYRIEACRYDLGSGGGNVGLLQLILDLTRENAHLIQQTLGLQGLATSHDRSGDGYGRTP